MYVVGYPRSGNTWLCYLLAYSLNAEYDDVDDPGVHPRSEIQRRYVKGGLPHASRQTQVGRILKTHALGISRAGEEPVAYLVRDGRDVMVSYYFYAQVSSRPPIPLTGRSSIFQRAIRKAGLSFGAGRTISSSFSSFLRVFAPDWAAHVRTWLEHGPQLVVRYEDLHADPSATLARVFAALDVHVLPQVVEEAVERFGFERMSGREPGNEDSEAFFRKGSTRDWKNHFSESDLEYFYGEAADLLRSLGYPAD